MGSSDGVNGHFPVEWVMAWSKLGVRGVGLAARCVFECERTLYAVQKEAVQTNEVGKIEAGKSLASVPDIQSGFNCLDFLQG